MRHFAFFTALICTGACLSTAYAGPNAGGTLIAALSEGTEYSSDLDYCDSVTATECANVVARVDGADSPANAAVINILAAFLPPGGRLAGVVWGWEYDALTHIVDYGSCGDFELPNSDWPASGEGTAITWLVAQTGQLVPVYWAAVYSDAPGSTLNLTGHPSGGGAFGDDSVPALVDAIAGYGVFGFGTAGDVPCPDPNEVGACCFPDGRCEIRTDADCVDYQGDGTDCDPNPCAQPTGACCLPDGRCVIAIEPDCEAQSGVFQGVGTDCDPNPCPPVPTYEASWGQIKSQYR